MEIVFEFGSSLVSLQLVKHFNPHDDHDRISSSR